MLTLRCIAGRIVFTMHGQRSRLQGELTLAQARALQAELKSMVTALELGDDQPGTLDGLIEQIGRRQLS